MTMEERLQSLFQILNNGDPLNADRVAEIIKAVRPEGHDDLNEIKRISTHMPASLHCLGLSELLMIK